MPKSIKNESVKLKSFKEPDTVRFRFSIENELDLIRVSEVVRKPIVTADNKTYFLWDGDVLYIYEAK